MSHLSPPSPRAAQGSPLTEAVELAYARRWDGEVGPTVVWTRPTTWLGRFGRRLRAAFGA